jgi:hemerythrin-like domain-containing protein
MKITDVLEIEHEILRNMLEHMSQWLVDSVAPDKLRERAVILEVAIEDHAVREEEQLFVPLGACSTAARELVSLMEVVHDEVRILFEEVANPANDPKERLWTIIMLTNEHFTKEETGVFPMAEQLLSAAQLEAQF